MPKIVDADARRREIAEKAVPVLVRVGIQAANLGDIAKSCGMGRSSLYEYFRNVDDLIDFVLGETFADLAARSAAVLGDDARPSAERLIALMDFLETYAIIEKNRMVLVLDFLFHPDRVIPGVKVNVQEQVRQLRASLEGALQSAVDAGEFRPLDAKSMAFTLFAFVEAATVHAALYGNISLDNAKRDIRLLIDGLRA
jgi:AcrR family transcriptional regulator